MNASESSSILLTHQHHRNLNDMTSSNLMIRTAEDLLHSPNSSETFSNNTNGNNSRPRLTIGGMRVDESHPNSKHSEAMNGGASIHFPTATTNPMDIPMNDYSKVSDGVSVLASLKNYSSPSASPASDFAKPSDKTALSSSSSMGLASAALQEQIKETSDPHNNNPSTSLKHTSTLTSSNLSPNKQSQVPSSSSQPSQRQNTNTGPAITSEPANNHHHSNSNNNHNHKNNHNHNSHSNNHNNNNNPSSGFNTIHHLTRTITLEELRKYFHLPIAEVARQFGTCTTALKKICRRLNISKWPYRQILSFTKSIQSLEMASLNEGVPSELRQQYRSQITMLHKGIAEVIKNPSKAMEALNHLQKFSEHHLNNNNNTIDDDIMDDSSIPGNDAKEGGVEGLNGSHHLPSTVTAIVNDKGEGTNISNSNGGGLAGSSAKAKSIIAMENEEVRNIIQAATTTLETPTAFPPSSSTSSANRNNAATPSQLARKTTKATKRANEDHNNNGITAEDLNRIKRGKSLDDILLTSNHLGGAMKMSIGGMILSSTTDNSNSHSHHNHSHLNNPELLNHGTTVLSSNIEINGEYMVGGSANGAIKLIPKSSLSSSSSSGLAGNGVSGTNITSPPANNPHSQYLVDVGVTSVACLYHSDQHKYHFTGQVMLAPLHRKKFRPHTVRRVVPLMEPDIGSNNSIDFFPNLTMPK